MNTKTNEVKDIQAYPSLNLAVAPKDMKYRFNWNAPIVTSMHNPKVMFHAANVLLKTTNGGLSWDAISPDLTRNDKSKQGPGGIPFTNEGAGGENYILYVIRPPYADEDDAATTASIQRLASLIPFKLPS